MENNHTIENNKIEKGEEENVKIITSDNKEFIVSLKIVRMSSVLTELTNTIDGIINLPNVDSLTFYIILEYCNHYVDRQKEEQEEINNLKKSIMSLDIISYFSKIKIPQLLKIILVSNHLDIRSLFLLSCKYLALQFEELSGENKLNNNEIENKIENEIENKYPWIKN